MLDSSQDRETGFKWVEDSRKRAVDDSVFLAISLSPPSFFLFWIRGVEASTPKSLSDLSLGHSRRRKVVSNFNLIARTTAGQQSNGSWRVSLQREITSNGCQEKIPTVSWRFSIVKAKMRVLLSEHFVSRNTHSERQPQSTASGSQISQVLSCKTAFDSFVHSNRFWIEAVLWKSLVQRLLLEI